MKCSNYIHLAFFVIIGVLHLQPIEGYKKIFNKIKCQFYECCQEPYVRNNFTKLEMSLNAYLYGQPLVKNTLTSALKSHFLLKNPRKSLVLSFHGSTGVGKNFVAQFVAESMFERGVKSKFFKLFIATRDFPHNERISEYKDKLRTVIESTVRECQTSLFVFDETDKIPIGLLDTIKAYVDYNQEVDGIDFRKAVFIFLSNSASGVINDLTLNLDKQQKDRDSFELKSFQLAIQNVIYYEKEKDNKGLYHASIIDSNLIDFYIPFLPLERIHVKRCIKTELDKYQFDEKINYQKNHLDKDVDSVADQLIYEPLGFNKYASSGCKRVPNLVRTLIVENRYHLKQEL